MNGRNTITNETYFILWTDYCLGWFNVSKLSKITEGSSLCEAIFILKSSNRFYFIWELNTILLEDALRIFSDINRSVVDSTEGRNILFSFDQTYDYRTSIDIWFQDKKRSSTIKETKLVCHSENVHSVLTHINVDLYL